MRPDDSVQGALRPPAFHWIFVLILSIVTVGLFADIWMIVQAIWARKLDHSNKALYQYVSGIVLTLAGLYTNGAMEALIEIAAIALCIVGSFSVRDSLGRYMTNVQQTPIYLSGVMTILLGPIYLQYHMNRVRSFQRHASLAAAR